MVRDANPTEPRGVVASRDASTARLFDWGGGGDAIGVTFATVYVVWALFLFGSARAPLANRLTSTSTWRKWWRSECSTPSR